MMSTETQHDVDIDVICKEIENGLVSYKLILLNDDHHSMHEVMRQIVKAVKCTGDQAHNFMMEAHSTGSSVILVSTEEAVKKAAKILEEIDLAITIEKEAG